MLQIQLLFTVRNDLSRQINYIFLVHVSQCSSADQHYEVNSWWGGRQWVIYGDYIRTGMPSVKELLDFEFSSCWCHRYRNSPSMISSSELSLRASSMTQLCASCTVRYIDQLVYFIIYVLTFATFHSVPVYLTCKSMWIKSSVKLVCWPHFKLHKDYKLTFVMLLNPCPFCYWEQAIEHCWRVF